MATPDPRIDAYIARAADFARPLLAELRRQVHAHCPEVSETMKWGFPHFMYRERILCSMAAFKAHCAFGFWLGEAMEIDGRSREAMGHFGRLTSLADLPGEAAMQALVFQAMALLEAGAQLPSRSRPKEKKPLAVPEDLREALEGNPEAGRTFEAFSPSRKREYVEWIEEAKTAATRTKRLAQAVAWMAEGKPRNWKYLSC